MPPKPLAPVLSPAPVPFASPLDTLITGDQEMG